MSKASFRLSVGNRRYRMDIGQYWPSAMPVKSFRSAMVEVANILEQNTIAVESASMPCE
jgi:hypothetical protein